MAPGSLEYKIKCVEETIRTKEGLGKDTTFEKGLVKEWKRYLPGGDKHHLWLQHSNAARRREVRKEIPPIATKTKTGRGNSEGRQLIFGKGFAP